MWSLAPAIRAIRGSSLASEPSLACHVPSAQGIWDKAKGLTPCCAASAENRHPRQKRTPPEIPRSRQVTAVHVRGDMAARAGAVRREPSVFTLKRGRTDIDVMMVTGTLLVRRFSGARTPNDPDRFAQPLIQ